MLLLKAPVLCIQRPVRKLALRNILTISGGGRGGGGGDGEGDVDGDGCGCGDDGGDGEGDGDGGPPLVVMVVGVF